MNSDSRNKLSGLTGDNLEVGELALITEADYERLYCKNNDGEVVPIHRIADAGEIVVPFVAEPCTFTTTGTSQNVRLINKQEYAKKITLEDGTDIPITGTGRLNYTFADIGDHKVTIEFKEDITDFTYCFRDCSRLTSIPENLFANNTAVTDFSSCFFNCSGLTGSIPENLFANNTAVTTFASCFYNCSGLTGSIPENLFANNTAVNYFTNCFYNCSGLTSIPETLFANCPNVTDFGACFAFCSGLTSIPENLFATNTAVTYFYSCFQGCSGLTSVPQSLFATNTAVTNFSQCFKNCSGLTGKVPVDNDGTPIYNRSGSGKEGYVKVTNYSYCFQNCTNLTDYSYSSIPSGWK